MTRMPAPRLAATALLAALLCLAAPARATPIDAGMPPATEACAALGEARANLMRMLEIRDQNRLKAMRSQLYGSSAALEGILSRMRATDAARVAEFRPVWEAFKKTREQEILPALSQGRHADARAFAVGVQAERLARMRAIMACP